MSRPVEQQRPAGDNAESRVALPTNPELKAMALEMWERRLRAEQRELENQWEAFQKEQIQNGYKQTSPQGKNWKEIFAAAMLDRDALENVQPPVYLIDKYLVRDSLAMLFGTEGAGKSFVAVDFMMHIATGRDWHGYEIMEPEPVVYIAAEGSRGIKLRVKAWEQYYNDGVKVKDVHLMPDAANFMDQEQVKAITEVITGFTPALVVIDTLARSTTGGDENSAKDMGIMIDAADQLRRATGACVLPLHHTGHENTTRGRGSSSIGAALQTNIRVEMNKETDVLTLTMVKQKDDEVSKKIRFDLRQEALDDIKIHKDGSEEAETSCVLVDNSEIDINAEAPSWINVNHEKVMDTLRMLKGEENLDVTSKMLERKSGMTHGVFSRALRDLKDRGMVGFTEVGKEHHYFLIEKEPTKLGLVRLE